MVPVLRAIQFHRFMSTGRTSPALCGCELPNSTDVSDYVVKLRGGMERGIAGLVSELVGSRLASYFGIAVPVPAIVEIDEDFAELVAASNRSKSERLKRSIGLNFGSRQLNDVMTWPVDKAIPDAMWEAALSIFAFDALIQNPDRRFSPNPNLFSQGDQIYVYDHELAFSFIEDILPARSPWRLEGCRYLIDHVFYTQLKGKPINLSRFSARLAALPEDALPGILAEIPEAWNNGHLNKITAHLIGVAGQAAEFAEEIRRRLA